MNLNPPSPPRLSQAWRRMTPAQLRVRRDILAGRIDADGQAMYAAINHEIGRRERKERA